uniref:RT08523p n=1 Tax=Drosophila melanogaster TaxID=7227 RepID=Q9VPG9_DROME
MDMMTATWMLCLVLCSTAMATEEESGSGLFNVTGNPLDTEAAPKLPSEVQKAVCTVTAGEVKASAEAVTTKTLKGVCGSDEMNMAFRSLENKLYEELRVMKLILVHLAKANGLKLNTAFSPSVTTPPPTMRPITSAAVPPIFKPIDPPKKLSNSTNSKAEENEVAPDFGLKKTPTLKNLDSNANLGARENEVDKFNNTVLADQDVKLFTYYWKLENVTELIKAPKLATVSSPIFSFKGKSLQLKCTFHHMNRELLNLQLGYGVFNPKSKTGQSNNILLEMDGIFQNTKWTEDIQLKHKISILDQSHTQRRTQDLSSQVLNKLDTGFSIPNSVLLGSSYIKQNALLIQILLYL